MEATENFNFDSLRRSVSKSSDQFESDSNFESDLTNELILPQKTVLVTSLMFISGVVALHFCDKLSR